MKNLKVCNVSLNKLDFSLIKEPKICYGCDETSTVGEVFTCGNNLTLTNFGQNGQVKWEKDLTECTSEENSPINVTFLTLSNTVCVGLSNGEIYMVSDYGNMCDLAGICDGGLQAMEWSPDQELVVLITKDQKMILMSCTFDPVHEVFLNTEEFGEKQFITVGWGKKETQFHGSEGKKAAEAKVEVTADINASTDILKISWRGDGKLYAVGFTANGIRNFKVFDRDGHLQYTSEKQPGLETNLSWRPSGNVIATTQKLPEKYVVAFFEKNGLKHGVFNIPNTISTVEDLSWSYDSEIIALQCMDITNEKQKVLLFTTSNYHWYLKQTITFKLYQKIIKLFWDNDFDVANNKKLHIILEDGQHFSYTWIWNVDHGTGKGNDDDAVIAVIDGMELLLTGFRQSVVPPPMAALELELNINVNSVHFYQGAKGIGGIDSNTFFVITEDSKVIFYKQSYKCPLKYEQICSGNLEAYEIPLENYNWRWISHNIVTCIQHKDGNYNLLSIGVDLTKQQCKFNIKHSIALPDSVMTTQVHPTDHSKLFIHLNSGEIVEYTTKGDINLLKTTLPTACPKFSVLLLDNELIFLGLSHKGNFYYNDTLIMNNVSSYFIHSHFLLLTTLHHVLLCTGITKVGLKAIIENQKIESPHVYKRKIERGAKLVIAIPNDTRAVFQMPRGNLETIQPRPLSVKIIGEYLDALKYHEAFDLMRKQRINLNLIFDHNPNKFLNHVDVFLEKVKNTSWLNLFLSDLENIDVTKTMYSSSYAERNTTTNIEDNTKVVRICDIIRTHIVKRPDRDSKVLPLLTTFVKKNNVVDLENALTIIKQLKVQESAGHKKPVGSDEALKYLLYMVDVNNLFDVALGMYDFDLVLYVASKSQKDPKEYVQMLNELNVMEENYKRFTVNKHLKRFDRAVECLAKCGPEKYDELKSYVKYHSLYREALELFSPCDEIYKQIADDFGLYLKLKKHFVEAGVEYRRAENFDKAIECFKEALQWELAIELAHSWPKEQFEVLCQDLVKALSDEKRHTEALVILEQFCDNNEAAILYAIKIGHYKTALRFCSQYKRTDLRDSHLLPAILEEFNTLKELISLNETTFLRHKRRLHLVRANKNREPVELYDKHYASKDSDLYSDAGSTVASAASKSSGRTFRSSKNRRKHERKVASLKEGSQYEDVALVMALHTLVTSTFELRPQVKEINIALISFGKDKEALTLQTNLERLLKEMKESFKDIWTNEFVLQVTKAVMAAQNVPIGCNVIPQGIATLEPHIRIAPVVHEISWKLDGLY